MTPEEIQKLVDERDALSLKIGDLEKEVQRLNKAIDDTSPEAVYSFNTNGLCKDGLCGTWTIRARSGEEGKSFFHRVENFMQYALAHGWQLPSARNAVEPNPPAASSTKANAQTNGTHADSGLAFRVDLLEGQVQNGKASWKAKGGKFTQYGVTVYPEVLKAAGLTIADGHNFAANGEWIATYVLGDKGKPYKVIELTKAK